MLRGVFTARRYASAVYAVMRCLSVLPSVCLFFRLSVYQILTFWFCGYFKYIVNNAVHGVIGAYCIQSVEQYMLVCFFCNFVILCVLITLNLAVFTS